MLLLSNALILDGSGDAPFSGSVLIREGRILASGAFERPADVDEIDLQGLALAPGFIDLHSHSDLQVLENRLEKSNQGVTTEVVGNCGFSPYPCGNHAALVTEQNEGILHGSHCWTNAAAYLAAVRESSRLMHVESLIGHGALRTSVLGHDAATTQLQNLDGLERVLDEALAEGAIGFSTGLMYAPGSQAPFAELESLCRVVARRGRLYTTHMRSYAWQLIESIEEQIELARRTGCRLQISHLQAVGKANWDKQQIALDRIEQAQAEGIDIGFDCYPYLAGSTVLTQLLPQAALSNGIPGLMEQLADSTARAALEHFLNTQTAQGWDDIFLSSVATEANRPLVGRHIAAISEERSATPAATVIDLIAEERGKILMISFNQSEANLRTLLQHPLSSIITDGFYVDERPHPRLAGAFPAFLGEFVRERKYLALPEAIRKITSQPASRLGLKDRGRIAPGAIADITIFDPLTIGSPATFDSPTQPPVGIHLVIKGQLLLPKSSVLLNGEGMLATGASLAHIRPADPGSTELRSTELSYLR